MSWVWKRRRAIGNQGFPKTYVTQEMKKITPQEGGLSQRNFLVFKQDSCPESIYYSCWKPEACSLNAAGLQGQIALVSTAANVWQCAPQRAAQAIDRLMAHRLVDGSAVVRWAFSSPGLLTLSDQISNGLAWEAIYNAVNKTLARTQVGLLRPESLDCHLKVSFKYTLLWPAAGRNTSLLPLWGQNIHLWSFAMHEIQSFTCQLLWLAKWCTPKLGSSGRQGGAASSRANERCKPIQWAAIKRASSGWWQHISRWRPQRRSQGQQGKGNRTWSLAFRTKRGGGQWSSWGKVGRGGGFGEGHGHVEEVLPIRPPTLSERILDVLQSILTKSIYRYCNCLRIFTNYMSNQKASSNLRIAKWDGHIGKIMRSSSMYTCKVFIWSGRLNQPAGCSNVTCRGWQADRSKRAAWRERKRF